MSRNNAGLLDHVNDSYVDGYTPVRYKGFSFVLLDQLEISSSKFNDHLFTIDQNLNIEGGFLIIRGLPRENSGLSILASIPYFMTAWPRVFGLETTPTAHAHTEF